MATKDCKAPGGKLDPNHDAVWDKYWERKREAIEKAKAAREKQKEGGVTVPEEGSEEKKEQQGGKAKGKGKKGKKGKKDKYILGE